jgi:hypothetical protein
MAVRGSGDQGCMFRLETRTGEFTAVASLKVASLEAEGNQHARNQFRLVRGGI